MKYKPLIISTVLLLSGLTYGQINYPKTKVEKDSVLKYLGGSSHSVTMFHHNFKTKIPKNIILMIGDGMGVSQVFAGLTANRGELFIENCRHIGFSRTQSYSGYITDSAAGATALSTGIKTYNGAIGVNNDTIPVRTILEEMEELGRATGLVSTSSITNATPASFIAHQKNREMNEAIALDFLKSEVDVFIGGGLKYFKERSDGKDLTVDLKEKGYKIYNDMEAISKVKKGKLAGLTAYKENGRVPERGDLLPTAAETAINILKKNKLGFFLMVEGSQIDWGSHRNNTIYTIEEMLDFDRTIGKVLEFASRNGETLVIITADHETGGMSIVGGDMEKGTVSGAFSTDYHTATMVPVFAYGPGAENFIGIMENTDIYLKMKRLMHEGS